MNIIITGASSGLGFEAALHLLQNKEHTVLALARSAEGLNKLKQIAASDRLHILSFNIVTGNYNNILKPFVQKNLGSIDVLINNAGYLVKKLFAETTIADLEQMIQANLTGHVRMIQAMLPYMNAGSHIVNIGSMGGYQGSVKFTGLAAYSASKAALHTLTECLAMELADSNIKVNCLAPGSAQTEMLSAAFPGYQSPTSAVVMGRYIADFALTGHRLFNGKILPVSVSTP